MKLFKDPLELTGREGKMPGASTTAPAALTMNRIHGFAWGERHTSLPTQPTVSTRPMCEVRDVFHLLCKYITNKSRPICHHAPEAPKLRPACALSLAPLLPKSCSAFLKHLTYPCWEQTVLLQHLHWFQWSQNFSLMVIICTRDKGMGIEDLFSCRCPSFITKKGEIIAGDTILL